MNNEIFATVNPAKAARSNRRRLSRKFDTFRRPKPHRVKGKLYSLYSHAIRRIIKREEKRDKACFLAKAGSRICACGNLRKDCGCGCCMPDGKRVFSHRNFGLENGAFVRGCYVAI